MSDFLPETTAKILVAEDDDAMRRFLEITLKKQNYRVSVAKDGAEALELALKISFDVVVTDAVMPNLTGYDLCRILRQSPTTKDLPIVILTGFDNDFGGQDISNFTNFYLRKSENLKNELIEILSNLTSTKS